MFTVPELPYAYSALDPAIDEKTMQIHHDKHHAAYVKNLNDALAGEDQLLTMSVETLVQCLDQVPEPVRTKVRNNAGGHANHSLFWTVMTPPGQSGKLSAPLEAEINKTFGSLAKLQEQMSAKALGRFGSGWAWLAVEQRSLLIIDTPNQDSPLMEGKTPILGIDVWEHAYYLKYQNLRADYIKAWWSVVNWVEVSRRYGLC